jgi:hypothetical protein
MSIFKNHKTSADRSASDRSRHKEKIKRALKEGIYNIVSDESIIGQDGKKRIKIPVRGIKEFQFIFGDNKTNRKVASAPGKDIKKGQRISEKKKAKRGDEKAGNQKGEEFYEVEITLEELSHYLFDSLNLPDLEKKKFKNLLGEKMKRSGHRNEGIRPRLSKKESLKRKIRREKATKRENNSDENSEDSRFPFHDSDLRYRHIKLKPRENSDAAIFFIMDTSGSMNRQKKFMARSFFFLLYHFLRHKYENIELIFISHTTEAKEVNEDDFFKRGSSGGTLVSSGLDKCLEIIRKRYHPDSWNLYTFHCSDGDNWPEDNDKSVSISHTLKEICQLYCYVQIVPSDENNLWTEGGMAAVYESISDNKFKIVKLQQVEDIWKEFNRIFGGSKYV